LPTCTISQAAVGRLCTCLHFEPIETTLILLGINLIIAIPFGSPAARSSPSHAEREALRVWQQSLDAARGALSLAALIPVGNTLLRYWRNNRSLVRR
jgi:HD-like signal output (HDOD) protein